jgi:CheY-like chemotaxis protein
LGRTILVADDSPTIQKKASGILTGEGLDVVTVSNGVAAVKKLPTVKPLVVLADVSMPGKDGYEVCEHIKSNADLSHISVLLVFSDTDPYEEPKGARVGADGRIKKPFDRDELVATVSKFAAQSEAALAPKQASKAAPPAEYEVEPVDEEQEVAARQEAPDLSAFSGGVAFGVPAVEEVPSVPADAAPGEPMMAEPLPSPEEPPVIGEEVIESVAPVVATETEPTEEIPSPIPTLDLVEPMLVEEAAVHEAPEEEVGERTMMFRAPADIAQPILSDEVEVEPEPAPPAPEPATMEAPAPAEELFAAEPPLPQGGTEPVEAEPEPASAEAPVVAEPAEVTPPAGTPVATQTLSGFTLSEAAAGRIRFGASETEIQHEPEPEASPQAEAPPAPEATPAPETASVTESVEQEAVSSPAAEVAPPQEAPVEEQAEPAEAASAQEAPVEEHAAPSEAASVTEPAPQAEAPAPVPPSGTIDEAQVYSIVHKVVTKMSPRALSSEMIDDLARKFADEITTELKSES